jgi:transcriptional regulator with XRE-family HTH domain
MSRLIERIRARLDALGLKPATAARAAGLHPDYLRNILEAKSLSPRADKLAQLARVLQCDLPYLLGEAVSAPLPPPRHQDLREEPAPFGHAPAQAPPDDQLPIHGSAEGGPFGLVVTMAPIEYVRRPEPLARVRDAFGLYMIGEAMSPKYEAGDLLLVHPTRPATPRDHVLALRGGAITGLGAPGPLDATVGRYLGRDDAGRFTLDHHAAGPAPTLLSPGDGWRLQVIVGSYDGRR